MPVGVLAARHRGRLTATLEAAAYVGHALPGITIGLALVFFGIRLLTRCTRRHPLLVLGYAVLFLPLAVGRRARRQSRRPRPAGGGRPLARLRPAARCCARVTLPLAAPGVGAGAALVFLTA